MEELLQLIVVIDIAEQLVPGIAHIIEGAVHGAAGDFLLLILSLDQILRRTAHGQMEGQTMDRLAFRGIQGALIDLAGLTGLGLFGLLGDLLHGGSSLKMSRLRINPQKNDSLYLEYKDNVPIRQPFI